MIGQVPGAGEAERASSGFGVCWRIYSGAGASIATGAFEVILTWTTSSLGGAIRWTSATTSCWLMRGVMSGKEIGWPRRSIWRSGRRET
jgi:hypothetical protein